MFVIADSWFHLRSSHDGGLPFGEEDIAHATLERGIRLLHVVRHLIRGVHKVGSQRLFESL